MGADYRKSNRAIFQCHNHTQLPANLTRYMGINGQIYAAELDAQFRLPLTGTIRRMIVTLDDFPGAGENVVFTMFHGGGATPLTVTIAGAAQITGNDFVNTEAYVANGPLSVRAVTSLNFPAIRASITFELMN